MTDYTPAPIATGHITLTAELAELTEKLAENVHDQWAIERQAQGWRYGPNRNDPDKLHPCLVSYSDLPDSEKEFDRRTAMESLKAILALGFTIEKAR